MHQSEGELQSVAVMSRSSLVSLGEGWERSGLFLSSCSLNTYHCGPGSQSRRRRSISPSTCSLGSGLDGLGGDRRRSSETLYQTGRFTCSGENSMIIVSDIALATHAGLMSVSH